jgi:hypothetical protein
LEAEYSGFFAESGLFAEVGLFAAEVEDGFSIGLFAKQDILIKDVSDLVCGSSDGLRCTEPGTHASEELPK